MKQSLFIFRMDDGCPGLYVEASIQALSFSCVLPATDKLESLTGIKQQFNEAMENIFPIFIFAFEQTDISSWASLSLIFCSPV